MTSNGPTRESEGESDVREVLDDEWYEQQNVQVASLNDKEEGSRSSARVRVFEPENDDKSAVALSVESQTEDCVVKIDVSPALVLADKLGQVAERVSSRVDR
jgi:molybdopterin-biosynthesis enzyme MoeA-like protein